jgi:hypothetical protein
MDALTERLAPARHLVVQARTKSDGRRRLYVGRGQGKRGRFGNPFNIRDQSEAERVRVVAAFDQHVRDMSPGQQETLLQPIREHLEAGGVLACFCAPKLCHGQVWAWWALAWSVRNSASPI